MLFSPTEIALSPTLLIFTRSIVIFEPLVSIPSPLIDEKELSVIKPFEKSLSIASDAGSVTSEFFIVKSERIMLIASSDVECEILLFIILHQIHRMLYLQ